MTGSVKCETARCLCNEPATNQAVYRRDDGTHFLGSPVCDAHRYRLGRPEFARGVVIIDYLRVRRD